MFWLYAGLMAYIFLENFIVLDKIKIFKNRKYKKLLQTINPITHSNKNYE